MIGPERLGDIAVHPGGQAPLTVALHGIGGHGDNRQMAAGRFFPLANRRRRLEAVHLRHLNVHQHQIERRVLQRLHRFPAVACDRRRVAPLFQDAYRQPLVYRVVLGNKDTQMGRIDRQGRLRIRRAHSGRRRIQRVQDRIQQFRLLQRLGQIGRQPQFSAADGVAHLPCR